MIYSMTGYGKASVEAGGRQHTIEVRSLNSKFLDLNLKTPGTFRLKEMALRSLVNTILIRGKVELSISSEVTSASSGAQAINKPLFGAYLKELRELKTQYDIHGGDIISTIMRMPDIMQSGADSISENDWLLIEPAVIKALEKLKEFRAAEGAELRRDLEERVQMISDMNKKVEEHDPSRVNKIRERIHGYLAELKEKAQIDESRLEQEMIFYIEKLDITEEIVRLKSHCEYFLSVIHEEGPEKGKKLNFISQEIGREINTIGSKSNDAPMQKYVVQMKEQLEKIKEQLNNVL